MSFLRRAFVPTAALLLSACAQQAPSTLTLENHPSHCQPLRLSAGQEFNLRLPSNPTTGFRWEVRDNAASVLQSLGPEVYSNPEDAGLVGAGGISTWRFTAREPGEGRLLLTYQQPWEPNVPPAETFECELRVK